MYRWVVILSLISVSSASLDAESLTLEQAVRRATDRYPSVQVAVEQMAAAAAGINLARTSYLPRVDTIGQVDRATRNNVFGLMLPQPLIPPISGPVLGTNSLTNVWGSAVGVLVSWEPFDFGLRQANVGVAESSRKHAEATLGRTRFDIASAAADAFLTLLAAEQTVRAAQAGVDRARVLGRVVDALVRSELRPGADAARTNAEIALAETQVIQADQAAAVARAGLAQLLGLEPEEITVQAGPLLDLPPQEAGVKAAPGTHPQALEQNAAIEEAKARERAIARSYFPRFNLQAASYARGTGAHVDGSTGGGLSGLGPNIQNWALGMTVTFPVLDLPSVKARREIEAHREKAETARYQQVLEELRGRRERAQAAVAGAERVAKQTPIQLDAARTAERQATARYRAGLGIIVDVAEAQRLLTQAEIDDALARLNVWRARLALVAAQGDLGPFLKAGGGK